MFDLLRDVNQRAGTTFLIGTHDSGLAARCDRIIELVDGRIVADRPNPNPVRRHVVTSDRERDVAATR